MIWVWKKLNYIPVKSLAEAYRKIITLIAYQSVGPRSIHLYLIQLTWKGKTIFCKVSVKINKIMRFNFQLEAPSQLSYLNICNILISNLLFYYNNSLLYEIN